MILFGEGTNWHDHRMVLKRFAISDRVLGASPWEGSSGQESPLMKACFQIDPFREKCQVREADDRWALFLRQLSSAQASTLIYSNFDCWESLSSACKYKGKNDDTCHPPVIILLLNFLLVCSTTSQKKKLHLKVRSLFTVPNYFSNEFISVPK